MAAQRVAHFSGGTDEFAGWLFGIARNLASNTRRRARRRATDPHPVEADPLWGTLETHAGDIDGADWVRRTLARLPRREGEVLALTEVVGLDVTATATALGISPTAVRVARHRGLTRLRRVPVPQQASAPAIESLLGSKSASPA